MLCSVGRTIAVALLLLSAPAYGASQKDRNDCDKEEGEVAIDACTRVINDRAESRGNRATAFFGRGEAWFRKGELDRAMADFSETIKLDPKYPGAYMGRGYVWRDKGDLDHAIADFTQMIRLDPKYAGAYSHRGLAWVLKGDQKRALADITEALRLAPRSYWSHTARAIYDHFAMDYAHAIAEYDQSIRLAPVQNAYAQYGRGVAKLRKGDSAAGEADIAAAKKMMPDMAERFARSYGITVETAAVGPAAAPPAVSLPTNTARPAAASPPAIDCTQAGTHWQGAEDIDTLAAYQDHLTRFPNCDFAVLAKARIEQLQKKQ